MIFSHLWDIRHTSSQPHKLRREVKATLLPPPSIFFPDPSFMYIYAEITFMYVYTEITFMYIYMQKLLSCMYIQKLRCLWFSHTKITRIMDVVPDTDLDNFMENLGISESEEGATGAASSHTTVSTSGKLQEPQCDDIWRDVTDVLNNWSQQILDAVSKCYSWAGNFQQTINELLKESNWTVFLPITI